MICASDACCLFLADESFSLELKHDLCFNVTWIWIAIICWTQTGEQTAVGDKNMWPIPRKLSHPEHQQNAMVFVWCECLCEKFYKICFTAKKRECSKVIIIHIIPYHSIVLALWMFGWNCLCIFLRTGKPAQEGAHKHTHTHIKLTHTTTIHNDI